MSADMAGIARNRCVRACKVELGLTMIEFSAILTGRAMAFATELLVLAVMYIVRFMAAYACFRRLPISHIRLVTTGAVQRAVCTF